MSTITLLTVLQVISDRKTAILKDLERIDTDKRIKNAEIQKPALYARIDECDKILELLKFEMIISKANEPDKIPTVPINRSGNQPGQLFDTLVERADPDALGIKEEGANGPGLVTEKPNPYKFVDGGTFSGTLPSRSSKDPLHPV